MELPRFEPHPWLSNPHRMTLAAAFWPRRTHLVGLRAQSRRIRVADGIDVEVWIDEPPPALGPPRGTVVLCHGLTGSAESHYLRGTADKALANGMRTARMNFRGAGGTEALSPSLYHSGLSGDVDAVVRELERDLPSRPLFVAGFSLGGNVVLKLAAEWGADPPRAVCAVVAVSAPVDLAACAFALEATWMNRRYGENFVRALSEHVRRVARAWPNHFDLDALEGISTVREFDERVTAPHFGFASAADYYSKASAAPLLPAIRIPTYILSSADDPLVPIDPLLQLQNTANEWLEIEITERGGHLGFVSAERLGMAAELPGDRFFAEHWLTAALLARTRKTTPEDS